MDWLIFGTSVFFIVAGWLLVMLRREKKKPERKWEFDKDGVPF